MCVIDNRPLFRASTRTMADKAPTKRRVAVLGAGIIGLSTAICLQEADPSLDITIIAEKFSPDTTSDGAAGIWSPLFLGDTPAETRLRWATATYNYLDGFLKTSKAMEYGVTSISGYFLSDQAMTTLESVKHLFKRHTELSAEDMIKLKFPSYIKVGYLVTDIVFCATFYLQKKIKEFQEKGGKVVKNRIQSFSELVDQFHVVVNCTGLGAQKLCQDKELEPVRGQIMKVKAPWLKHFYRIVRHDDAETGKTCYILPRPYDVVIGGTHQHTYCTEISKEDNDYIFEVTSKFEPSIKKAEVIQTWVGLRPVRTSVRVEKEVLKLRTENGSIKTLQVVHNYGHGGCGLSVFWGSALDAKDMVLSYLKSTT